MLSNILHALDIDEYFKEHVVANRCHFKIKDSAVIHTIALVPRPEKRWSFGKTEFSSLDAHEHVLQGEEKIKVKKNTRVVFWFLFIFNTYKDATLS